MLIPKSTGKREGHLGAVAWEAPLFDMCPTAHANKAVRADGTCLRHQSALRRGPQTVVGGQYCKQYQSAGAARPRMATRRAQGGVDVGATHTRKPISLFRLPGALLLR